MDPKANLIIRFRWLIIILTIGITVFFALQLPKTQIDAEIKTIIPKDLPARINQDKIEELFGGTDFIGLIFTADDILNPEVLKRIRKLTKALTRLKELDKVLSIFEMKNIKGTEGMMIVNPIVKKIPQNEIEIEQLRKDIKENDMVYGQIISKDFKAAAILGMVNNNTRDDVIMGKINAILAKNSIKNSKNNENSEHEVVIGGLPFIRVKIAQDIRGDIQKLIPLCLAIMLVFLFICFKQLRGVLLPFIVVVMSIIVAMGSIPLLGWKIAMMTVLLPVMLLAIANDYGIHLIAHYQEENLADRDISNQGLAKTIITKLYKPITATGLTTIAGMLCLLGHFAVPAEQLGILASIGITFALIASLVFIPSVLSILPKAKPIFNPNIEEKDKQRWLERMLINLSHLVTNKPKQIIIFTLLLTVVCSFGIFRVDVDTNPENYYLDESPVVKSSKLLNKHFGGSANISIVYEGDIKSPSIMAKIDQMEKTLQEMPEVGNTVSIARVVKQMTRVMNDKGTPEYDKVPSSRNAIAQYFELYSMSGDPEDFEKLVDFDYRHAQLSARIKNISSRDITNVVDKVKKLGQKDPDLKIVGGFATILGQIVNLLVRGQMISLFLSLIAVAILVMIQFKSFWTGLISIVPLTISIIILFGLMGYLGIELNAPTALLSSIMIGVGIDYTIHFLWRFKTELKGGLTYEDAVRKTLTTTGRGIVFNALSVIVGFSALLISNFLPVNFFGFLIIISISACLLGALIFIPSLCLIFKPSFLTKGG